MAEVELRAGAHLEFVTPKELAAENDRLADRFAEIVREEAGDTIVRSAPPFKTNASGTGSGVVYQVPSGFTAFVTRVIVTWPTASAKTGGTAATVLVCADAVSASTTRSINNTIPSVFEASQSHAPVFRGGQSVVVSVTAGPHTKTIFCTVQAVLVKRRPIKSDVLEPEGLT